MISCQLLPENELSQVGIDDAESGSGVLSADKGRDYMSRTHGQDTSN
jgi:hypothetical protein